MWELDHKLKPTKFIVRKSVHRTAETIKRVDRVYYRFEGVSCPCGNTTLKCILERMFLPDNVIAETSYFRCSRCGGGVFTAVERFRKDLTDAWVWLGITSNPAKI